MLLLLMKKIQNEVCKRRRDFRTRIAKTQESCVNEGQVNRFTVFCSSLDFDFNDTIIQIQTEVGENGVAINVPVLFEPVQVSSFYQITLRSH